MSLVIYMAPFRRLLAEGRVRLRLCPGGYREGDVLTVEETSQSAFTATGRRLQAVVTEVEAQGSHDFVTVERVRE